MAKNDSNRIPAAPPQQTAVARERITTHIRSILTEVAPDRVALTGQVVPTNVQCNALAQKFDIASCEPVAVGNSGEQANYSTQATIAPVGSVFVTPTWCAD